MSDNEAGPSKAAAGESGDSELGLPKASVNKIIQEHLPDGMQVAKDAKDLIADACKDFITLLAAQSSETADKASKKMIAPEHVVAALKSLGFESHVAEVEEASTGHQTQAKEHRQKKASRFETGGLTEEQLLAEQEKLMAASRAKFEAAQAGAS